MLRLSKYLYPFVELLTLAAWQRYFDKRSMTFFFDNYFVITNSTRRLSLRVSSRSLLNLGFPPP